MKKNIFVVEDDEGIRDMLEVVLSRWYSVELFENLSSFFKRIAQQKPDLIVMDIMLPDGNGDEAGLSLQKDATHRNIPILFMSANMKFEFASRMYRHDFIAKPFDIKALDDKIKQLLT